MTILLDNCSHLGSANRALQGILEPNGSLAGGRPALPGEV
jgi:hypothetical protein